MAEPRPLRPGPERPAPRSRPDPNPLRLILGVAGIASASALTAAMLPSVAPRPVQTSVAVVAPAPVPSVIHVTEVVNLGPGESAPPAAPVRVLPTPTPRVQVVVTTRQSGVP